MELDTQPRRHICHCGKGFVRNEHLLRHQAIHREPSFTCKLCGRHYSRDDVLQRHLKTHEPAATKEKARRPACDACRSKKRKCDNDGYGTTCSTCVSTGADCTYTPRKQNVAAHRDDEDNNGGFQVQLSLDGLRPILDVVKLSVAAPLARDMVPSTQEVQGWYDVCADEYSQQWHHRWPVTHNVHLNHEPFTVWASIVLSGCWLLDHQGIVEHLVLGILDRLMDRSFEQLKLPGNPEAAWKIENYQATLLEIILASNIGTKPIIARAELLLSLLVTELRRVGMFDSKTAEYQKETHFPGPFLPYVVTIYEQRSRLAAGLFKVDTYLGIRQQHPPHLQPEELDVNLPSTISALYSHPLPRLYPWQNEEPCDRKDRKIFELCSIPQLAEPSVMLVEDTILGLCGLWPNIWRFVRTGPLRRPSKSGMESIRLAGFLGEWKTHLANMTVLVGGQDSVPDQTSSFIEAYRRPDERDGPQGESSATRRANSLLHEAEALVEALRAALWTVLNPEESEQTQLAPNQQVSRQRYEFQRLIM